MNGQNSVLQADAIKKAFFAAMPLTLPVFTEFWFLGISYGFYMHESGFSFWYPVFMSIIIFAGAMEFATVQLMLLPFRPLQAFLLTLLVNSRHLFYGVSILNKYQGTGRLKPFLIFGMCDESFAINYNAEIPPDIDRSWFMFFVTVLNQLYWIAGAAAGGICGNLLHCNLKGIEFIMTTLYLVILLEQLLKTKNVISASIGLFFPAVCLLIFGKNAFISPSLLLIIAAISICRPLLEEKKE